MEAGALGRGLAGHDGKCGMPDGAYLKASF